jgi:hypothetical protein
MLQIPNLEDQVPLFMSSSERVVQLQPQAPDSLFVVFNYQQGSIGDIVTGLHTGSHNSYCC